MIKNFDSDTIAAIATPLGEGGIGVIRMSGTNAVAIADAVFCSKRGTPVREQPAFTAQLGRIVSPRTKETVDEVLLLLMRTPRSFTCEDVVEISAHGGLATLQAILQLLVENGARIAERGEFTKRAFLNGRIDLVQAEAVLDLVKAKTELTRQWAAAQLEGALSKKMKELRGGLVDILSHLEASIDFPTDFPETKTIATVENELDGLIRDIRSLLEGSQVGLLAKNGLSIAITGRPNVGKSSLMNRFAKFDRVIVTPYPGTTRDVVEEEIQLNGFPVRLLDTAGIQDTAHPIEKEGIGRSKAAMADSDLVLYVLDGSRPWHSEDETLLESLADKKKILVVNKSDLSQKLDRVRLQKFSSGGTPCVECSCVTEDGTKPLEDAITRFITQGKVGVSDKVVVSSVRQKDLLEKTLAALDNARQSTASGLSEELIAVDVRLALDHLGGLVGEVATDEVLDRLFSQFCIGK